MKPNHLFSPFTRSQLTTRLQLYPVLLLGGLLACLGAPPALAQSVGGMLQPEDQGQSVEALQQQLSDLGYYTGAVTGYFDDATQQAVSQFQQENGLTADGIVGAATERALYPERYQERTGEGATASPDQSMDPYSGAGSGGAAGHTASSEDGSVVELQKQLVQLGYYRGAITGTYDGQTQAAVVSFQQDRGLVADGIVGQATQSALGQTSPALATSVVTPTATTDPTATTGVAYIPVEGTEGTGLLQLGAVGSQVSTLQTQLQNLGYYNGPISGSFGSQTEAALIAFQQSQGLTPDGVAGPRVNTALSSAAGSSPAVAVATPQISPQIPAQPALIPGTGAVATPQPTGTVQVPPLSPAPTPTAIVVPPAQSAAPVQPTPRSATEFSQGGRFSILGLQQRLEMRGFDVGGMSGVYDSPTQDAILRAQQSYGINPDDLLTE